MKESSSSSPMAMAYLAELRKESPASSVGFSDPCPCCGNLKRRCLYDSSVPRKKLLVFDLSSPSSSSLTPTSPSSFSDLTADASPEPEAKWTKPVLEDSASFKIRRSPVPKSPPMAEAKAEQPPTSGSVVAVGMERGSLGAARVLERSNSSQRGCSAPWSRIRGDAQGEVEVRVGVNCKCGIAREIVLIQ